MSINAFILNFSPNALTVPLHRHPYRQATESARSPNGKLRGSGALRTRSMTRNHKGEPDDSDGIITGDQSFALTLI